MRTKSFVLSIAFFAGLLLVFVGERLVNPGSTRIVCSGVGVALALIATLIRAMRARGTSSDRAAVEKAFLGLAAIGLAALAVYFAQSDLPAKWGGKLLLSDSPKLAAVLAALWPTLMVVCLLPTLLMELSYGSMARSPAVETGRVREAMYSGFGLAGALIFAFALQYVMIERDVKWDLSYFRTAKPGEATRKIVQSLDEQIDVALFFPPSNDVGIEVGAYFEDLAKESPRLSVQTFDHALDPVKSRDLGVSGNGTVVVGKGTRREQLMLGVDLDKSRGQLRNLDQEFQKRLLQVAKAKKTIYFTIGHGERTEKPSSTTDQRPTISVLKDILKQQNYELRTLSVADGLASDIPKDAAAVVVVGPTSAFSAPEATALATYFTAGGRLLFALDPEPTLAFPDLVEGLGLRFIPETMTNDAQFVRRTGQLSDRTMIGAAQYSSHPAVTTLGRVSYPMVFMQAGHLEELKVHPAELVVDFSVRAHASTWNDVNGNYNHDPPAEVRKSWELVASVTRKPPGGGKAEQEGRAVVVADADGIADEILQGARGNQFFALDALKWLLGEENITGAINSEVDLPIQRTRQQEVLWFYGTIILAPAMVLGIGFLAARRTRGKKSSKKGVAP